MIIFSPDYVVDRSIHVIKSCLHLLVRSLIYPFRFLHSCLNVPRRDARVMKQPQLFKALFTLRPPK
jgi:hypothetical protein